MGGASYIVAGKLNDANLTLNLAKSEFVQRYVDYLGYKVGQGKVQPLDAKVKDIVKFPSPTNTKELLRFLGMGGYYRRFCRNFSVVALPLTRLLSKKMKLSGVITVRKHLIRSWRW